MYIVYIHPYNNYPYIISILSHVLSYTLPCILTSIMFYKLPCILPKNNMNCSYTTSKYYHLCIHIHIGNVFTIGIYMNNSNIGMDDTIYIRYPYPCLYGNMLPESYINYYWYK